MALQTSWQRQRQRQRGRRGRHSRNRGLLPLGLKNLGNSCYLNSVLQCLTYTPPLAQFCLSRHHSSLCKSVFPDRDKDCPFCILEHRIARSLTFEGTSDAPTTIRDCLHLFGKDLCPGRQEDAHEFLRYVINACHEACIEILQRLARRDLDRGTDMIMKDIFGGALLSQVKCLSCKKDSYTTDEIMDISLDLHQSNSLKDAFARFFHAELLDGSNKYNCQKCKKLRVARRQMFLKRAPNVLVIQLKRFADVNSKINRNIEFEEDVGLSKFMYGRLQEFPKFREDMEEDPEMDVENARDQLGKSRNDVSPDSRPDYNLFGSIVHSGCSLESGHYYAYIKDALGRWYCCNDAHVSPSSKQKVLSENVYILFYLRTNQSPQPSKTASASNEVPSLPKGNDTDGDVCSDMVENNKKQMSSGNGSSALKGKIDEDTLNQSTIGVNQEPDCHHSVNCVINNYGISVSKRKSFDAERGNCHDDSWAENLKFRKQSPYLSVVDSSCARKAYIKQFPEEIEKFKDVLAREAYSNLQSCDWYDKVYNFMCARKRLCIQETGNCPDSDESRKQLKNDARKAFASHIPESLKAHLIEQLVSFYQGK